MSFSEVLDFEDFFFFAFQRGIDFGGVLFGERVDFLKAFVHFVFGDLGRFFEFFEEIVCVAALIAESDFVIFSDAFGDFYEFDAAFAGKGRNGYADQDTIVGGVEAEVGLHNRAFDVADQISLPGLPLLKTAFPLW